MHHTLKACGGVDAYIHAFFILSAGEKCHMSPLHPHYFTLREIFLLGQCTRVSKGSRPG
jgi:hypothetical protein